DYRPRERPRGAPPPRLAPPGLALPPPARLPPPEFGRLPPGARLPPPGFGPLPPARLPPPAARLPPPEGARLPSTSRPPAHHRHRFAADEAHRRLHRIGLLALRRGAAATALLARRLESHRRHQRTHLVVFEFFPTAALQALRQRNRAMARTDQAADHQPRSLE